MKLRLVLGLPKQDIVELIDLTGELMYRAVRLGGAPCTGLPWRWGHGWPPCSNAAEVAVNQVGYAPAVAAAD